ncbi:hypothetical protein YC2023_115931 [Brassica napus]
MRRGCSYRKLLTDLRRLSDEIPTDVKQSVGIPSVLSNLKRLYNAATPKSFFYSDAASLFSDNTEKLMNKSMTPRLCSAFVKRTWLLYVFAARWRSSLPLRSMGVTPDHINYFSLIKTTRKRYRCIQLLSLTNFLTPSTHAKHDSPFP